MQGKTAIACFRNAAEYLINDNKEYESRKENVEDEAKRILTQEAKLILGQIRSTTFDVEVYPAHGSIKRIEAGKNWIPQYLSIGKQELKQVSIDHAIVNSVKPRSSVTPLMFDLGVEIDKVVGSKWSLTE
jgi:uncharacterized protein (UPF0335 family)